MNASTYPGQELTLFASAQNWKGYWTDEVRPFLGNDVLEVGAGLGANTGLLSGGGAGRWLCLEPDAELAAHIPSEALNKNGERQVQVQVGAVADLSPEERFDSVLYIDVLEHIEQDRAELQHVVRHLRPGGTLIVLAPAIPALFSPFDAAIGHFRRYTRKSLCRVGPETCRLEHIAYLDAAGVAASLANRLLMRRALPTPRQIQFWDRYFVPISRRLDPKIGYRAGKSILAVWRHS